MSSAEANKFPAHWKGMATANSFLSYANYLIEQQTEGRGPALVLVPEDYEEGYNADNDPAAEHTIFGIRIYNSGKGFGSTEPSYTSAIPGEALAQLIADMVCKNRENDRGD